MAAEDARSQPISLGNPLTDFSSPGPRWLPFPTIPGHRAALVLRDLDNFNRAFTENSREVEETRVRGGGISTLINNRPRIVDKLTRRRCVDAVAHNLKIAPSTNETWRPASVGGEGGEEKARHYLDKTMARKVDACHPSYSWPRIIRKALMPLCTCDCFLAPADSSFGSCPGNFRPLDCLSALLFADTAIEFSFGNDLSRT
ncbi:hypothetical protein J6590_034241 [Homalodisca vitripennis]|nr:hypothetical protein J6590_034241 [Homalodisca vitripennis]